jgi:hypothetical protein
MATVWLIIEAGLMVTGAVVWVGLAWIVVGEWVRKGRGHKGDLWHVRED